jgi:hypothetical protein
MERKDLKSHRSTMHSQPRRTTLIALCVLIGASGAVSGGSGIAAAVSTAHTSAATGNAKSGDLSVGSDCVSNFSQVRVDRLLPNGAKQTLTARQAASTTDTFGRSYVYEHGADQVSEIVPPTGWHPLTATAQELKTYGFAPRPTDAAKLAHWTESMSHWKSAGTAGMCITNKTNAVSHTANSSNWAGGMSVDNSATLNDFWYADGAWVEPTFDAVCPGYSSYTIWSGLGGWNSGRLLQSGTDTDRNATNGIYMWWEAIAPGHVNNEVQFTGDVVSPGDKVEATTYYSSGEAYLTVEDLTTGVTKTTSFTSYAGLAASGYYDGTTSDFITEAPSGGSAPGGLYYLRKPAAGSTDYYYAKTNGSPIADFLSWKINEVGSGTGNLMQYSNFNGSSAWADDWGSCS